MFKKKIYERMKQNKVFFIIFMMKKKHKEIFTTKFIQRPMRRDEIYK